MDKYVCMGQSYVLWLLFYSNLQYCCQNSRIFFEINVIHFKHQKKKKETSASASKFSYEFRYRKRIQMIQTLLLLRVVMITLFTMIISWFIHFF